jgi:cytochrome c peroxidase
MRKLLTISVLVMLITGIAYTLGACRKKDVAPKAKGITFEIPEGFPQPHYNFANNPLTEEGVELGRRLFYDGRLSKDGNFPCASCHQQFAAFVTFDHDLSHGFNNAFTLRNAPSLANLAWEKEFHRDGGINNLELQPLAPLTAPNEMAETVADVVAKIKADGKYQQMFLAAFGDGEINSQRMLKALSQFMVTMVSANSKYDRVRKGTASFTIPEQAGYTFFKAKCASCHQEPLLTDLTYRNNGLPLNNFLDDKGRMRITNDRNDSLKFKVPSLRNVNLTYPYMHDGRFWNLPQVLEHYRTGINQSATLDPSLRQGIPMTDTDKQNLMAFLRTLTDSSFLVNPKFSQPQ